jgi:hypothetical protein
VCIVITLSAGAVRGTGIVPSFTGYMFLFSYRKKGIPLNNHRLFLRLA